MIILIALLIGTAAGLLQAFCKGWRAVPDEKEEGAGVCESSAYLPILRDAFKTLSPNSRGRGSIAFLNLSTAIQRIEAGEELSPGVLVYLLNQIEGGAPWAEQIKGAGA